MPVYMAPKPVITASVYTAPQAETGYNGVGLYDNSRRNRL
jgi:hypothetical protein